jgi:hypothetical protein
MTVPASVAMNTTTTNLENAVDTLPERLFALDDLAEYLRVSRRTAERMRSSGALPKADLHIGKKRMPRWRPETIRNWVARQPGRN